MFHLCFTETYSMSFTHIIIRHVQGDSIGGQELWQFDQSHTRAVHADRMKGVRVLED